VIAFATWLVLSGHFDATHLSFGVAASVLVAAGSADLMFPQPDQGRIGTLLRWIAYLPYLFWRILKANLQVLALIFHPRMTERLDPRVVTFDTRLESDLARMNLGNSITLTPGTLTVLTLGRTYYVHALTPELAAGLPGDFEGRIAHIFSEDAAGEAAG
jgi:multicomponent Na+:H+ antiporter subunit E